VTPLLDGHHRIHFVGVGGAGMSALARFLVARGFLVSGSDQKGGEQFDTLNREGIAATAGHAAANVAGADLVVVTSAAPPDNPEVQEAIRRNVRIVKRAELLGAIVNAGHGVAVAGTHGKTTTSAMIGWILASAGLDPTILLGGVSLDLASNARAGAGPLVVAEADEYDASFLQMRPHVAVITNVNPEHLDFYGTVERMRDAYRQFASGVRDALIVCADEPDLSGIASASRARTIGYGLSEGDWRAGEISPLGSGIAFRVRHEAGDYRQTLRLAGTHNVLNSLAATAAAAELGVEVDVIASALASFSGVKRRMERKGESAGVLVVDDYAVHPYEVSTTLSAIRQRYRRPVRVVFQPHTYSRTRAFLDDFARSFGEADAVYVMDVYAAREVDTLGISGRDVAQMTSRRHPAVTYTDGPDETVRSVVRDARPGDVVVTMGAGDVTQLGDRILAELGS